MYFTLLIEIKNIKLIKDYKYTLNTYSVTNSATDFMNKKTLYKYNKFLRYPFS